MTYQSINNLYSFPQPLTRIFPAPIVTNKAPTVNDYKYPLGQQWINEVALNGYILMSAVIDAALWIPFQGGSSEIETLTGDSGGAIFPSGGNITLSGTANQITTTGTSGTITFSVPTVFIAPGSITSTTTITAPTSITATLGDITATNGNFIFGTAGNKFVSTSVASTAAAGANAFGTVPLVNGTVTVTISPFNLNSTTLIILTRISIGTTGTGAIGNLTTVRASTGFTINSLTTSNSQNLVTTDQSVVGWMVMNE